MNRKTLRRLFTVSALLLLASLTGCGLLFGLRDEDCSKSMHDMLQLTPPVGAAVLSESCSMGITPTYRLTFTFPPTELAAVQAMTGVTDWTNDAAKAVMLKDDVAGKTSVIYGTYGDGAFSVEVLIDTSRADLYTVYFYRAFVD